MDSATMTNKQHIGGDRHLEMHWAPVTDRHGRTRLEARWVTVGQESSAATVATAPVTPHAA